MFEVDDPRLEVEAFGLKFKNPIGLAAGYDKNGVAVKGLSALGFGHIEAGTLTRQKQIGNPKPRVHRVSPPQKQFTNFVDKFVSKAAPAHVTGGRLRIISPLRNI